MDYLSFKLNELNHDEFKSLVGIDDTNLKTFIDLYKTDITIRDSVVMFFNDDTNLFNLFRKHFENIVDLLKAGNAVEPDLIRQSFLSLKENADISWLNDIAGYTFSGKPIKYKTVKQKNFFDKVLNNDLVFSIGPAGTGKTFLAVLFACNYYKKENIKKIILSRPAVEAGESLGFLPGDLKEKVDPYLMPLYDALYEILGEEKVNSMIDKNIIEIIPLAYMRGRTLNDAFVILDEAQNTTDKQMLMFLTRLGKNTKMIINGDLSQVDLNNNKQSGLKIAYDTLKNIDGIDFIEFDNSDIVRNKLVEKIVERYNHD